MAHSSEPTERMPQPLKTSEDFNFKMRRSFSWNRAFFTNDGFLDADELSSMIEGDGNDVKHQLEPIEEIEKLEAKLFEEMEALTKKSNQRSTGSLKGSQTAKTQASKVTLGSSTPIKTQPTRSSPLSVGSTGNNVKSSTTMTRSSSTRSITGKPKGDSPSKTPPKISTKNKVAPVNAHPGFSNLSPKATPVSPISPGSAGSSSSSISAVSQRSSRGRSSSAPRRSSPIRRDHDQKPSKPSNINLKIKPPPNTSHPSSPLGLSNSSSTTSLTSSRPSSSSSSSSSSYKVTQRSKSTGRATTVNPKSLHRDAPGNSSMNTRSQTPDRNRKQPAVLYPRTSSVSGSCGMPSPKTGLFQDGKSNKSCLLIGLPETDATQHAKTGSGSPKERKLPATKRSSSPRPSRVQSSGKEKGCISGSRSVKNLVLVSPEILDIKGKLNALKMEISMQKNEKCKETKMVPTRICKSESSPNIYKNSTYQARPT